MPRPNGPIRSWAICYAAAIAGATAPHFQYQPVDPAHEIGDGLLDGVVGFLKLSLGAFAHRFAFTPARPPPPLRPRQLSFLRSDSGRRPLHLPHNVMQILPDAEKLYQ